MAEYRRNSGKSYLLFKQDTMIQSYEYQMLKKNKIAGLLSFEITNENGEQQFWYDISGRHSLENWMEIQRLGTAFLRKFITALKGILEQMGEYLLDTDGISLVPAYIFVDAKEENFGFCSMPFAKKTLEESLRSFMEYYLSHMEHGNGEDIQKCYNVYEVCQMEHIRIEEMLEILYEKENTEFFDREDEICQSRESEVKKPEIEEKDTDKKNTDKNLTEQKKKSRWKFPVMKKKIQTEAEFAYVFEPQEYVAESINPTVFLGSETNEIIGELRYEGDGNEQNIKINAPVFLIGNHNGEVDGKICDDTVSRIHAKITIEDGCYYMEDMNSTNGTYHNGELLNYMEKVKLEKNDRIIFSKEAYRFV